jgi:DNA polymerase-3 subunit epsilon
MPPINVQDQQGPQRFVVLDTETTGLEPSQGNRIIEVAGVEILGRRMSAARFHAYLNPGRDSEPGALEKHGLTTEFLSDKPRFEEVVDEFIAFIRGAVLIIHNAPFDVGFLNHELSLSHRPALSSFCPPPLDSLLMARELHPGKKNSLDALCDRYGVDNSHRTYHGALLDAELLADVYLAMTRGQESLVMDLEPTQTASQTGEAGAHRPAIPMLVVAPSVEELAEHARILTGLEKASKGECIWLHQYTPEHNG